MGNKVSGGKAGKIPQKTAAGSGRFEHAIDDEKGGRKEQDAKVRLGRSIAVRMRETFSAFSAVTGRLCGSPGGGWPCS